MTIVLYLMRGSPWLGVRGCVLFVDDIEKYFGALHETG